MSLLVILMVPVCVLAAAVAAAVPQRLAAQAAMDDAAAELAAMTLAWQDLQGRAHDSLGWFFPDCAPPPGAVTVETADGADSAAPELGELASAERAAALEQLCVAATDSLFAELGARGIDANQLSGYHTSAYSTISVATQADSHLASVPCRTGDWTVSTDAVSLGVVAPWGAGNWAAEQVWPHGLPIGSQTVAVLSRPASSTDDLAALPVCTALHRPPSGTDALQAPASAADAAPSRTAFGNLAAP